MSQMQIAVVHVHGDSWESELCAAVQRAAKRHTASTESVQFCAASGHPADLVVFLGSEDAASDLSCQQKLVESLNRHEQILPIVHDLSSYSQCTPPCLHEINGMQWTNAEETAEFILRQLGLTEPDRRLFLSYRRIESTPVALQLYEHLHRRCYSVFLDRFDVEASVKVQPRIYEALQEMSFVLLLESPGVRSSRWVEEEIGYAIQYGLGLIAISFPGIVDPPPFIMVPEDKRERLGSTDLTADGRLTDNALDRVLLRIEQEHADQIRSRRERMIEDMVGVLDQPGRTVRRVGQFSLICRGSRGEALVRVCPRPPSPRDLFGLALEQREFGSPTDGWIVGTQTGYHEGRHVTEWIARSLTRRISWFAPPELSGAAAIRLD